MPGRIIKDGRFLIAAVVILILINVFLWGTIFSQRGDGEVLQLWDGDDLHLSPEAEEDSPLMPGRNASESDKPEEFQLQKEEIEVEQP